MEQGGYYLNWTFPENTVLTGVNKLFIEHNINFIDKTVS